VATFSASGALNGTPAAYTFNANATSSLNAGTTYYLRFAYAGADEVNWIRTNTDFSSTTPGFLNPVDAAYPAGTPFYYRATTGDGFTDFRATIGGFSITANAVSAIPEPGTYAAFAGAATLVAGFVVRWRRARNKTAPTPAEVAGV
jgi:hypothetical protein